MRNELSALKKAVSVIGNTVNRLAKDRVDVDYICKNITDALEEMWFAEPEYPSSRITVKDRQRFEEMARELTDNPDPDIVAIGTEIGVWLQRGE